MTTLEALQILKSKQPTELTQQELDGLRAFLEGHPELALIAGGRDRVEQYLAAANAHLENPSAESASGPAGADADDKGERQVAVAERAVNAGNAPPSNHAAGEKAAAVPSTVARQQQSHYVLWAVMMLLLFLVSALCVSLATRYYDHRTDQITKAATKKPAGGNEREKVDQAVKDVKAVQDAENVRSTPGGEPPPASTESVSPKSQWQGWDVESPAEVTREVHWEPSDSEGFNASVWLTSRVKLKLSQTRTLAQRDKWLCIDAQSSATVAAPGTIEVFIQDTSIARFNLPDNSSKSAEAEDRSPSGKNEPDKKPGPLHVQLIKWQGKRIELSIVFQPAAAEQVVTWHEVSIGEDQKGSERKVATPIVAARTREDRVVRRWGNISLEDKSVEIDTVLTGSDGLTLRIQNNLPNQTRRLTLNAANTYTGVTMVDSDFGKDFLYLRAGNPLAFGGPADASLAFGQKFGQERQIVELYGNDITVMGLNYPGGNDGGGFGAFGAFVINNAATDATLTVDTSTADSVYNGFLGDVGTGKLGLTVIGGGQLTLRTFNTYHAYSGGLTIMDGTVAAGAISGGGAFGTGGIALGSAGKTGTIKILSNGNETNSSAITLATGGRGAFDNPGGTITLSGVVSGEGELTKTGAGALTLKNVNTYTGDTTVSDGTFTLADNAGMTFDINGGAAVTPDGDFTGIEGTGTLILNGDFTFDVSDATKATGNTWQIVDNSSLKVTYGATFSVNGFTETVAGSGVWTLHQPGVIFKFDEQTGLLSMEVRQ